ncbi:hypothetical protein POM88_054658 [Heracleum sosnowskyi]|uniref:Uncharacterized protein n=1 Tax=Heracleum sosnowskyi TaxID=360622 RepID=A0AAD8GMM1_9APIA|nr:hypothetical protein POM88_054656 [Heracleum sosnowskyi]KAK1350623.1 hypothetical protein POM88_054658 [Heracleum sosnowskyi]
MTGALQIRVHTEELHKKAMEEVNCDGDFVGMKQVVVGKTIKEGEQKREGSISTEEIVPINNIPEYDDDDDDYSSVDADDLTSVDDADSTSGYNDEADDEDYISEDDGLINNKADGLADFDEFRRNIPSDVYDTDSDYGEGEDVIMTPYFAITGTSASTHPLASK